MRTMNLSEYQALARSSTIALIAPSLGCGKTTVARYLSTQYGYEIVPFARPVKLMITSLLQSFGIGPREIEYLLTKGKEEPIHGIPGSPTMRRLLQTLGNEYGRQASRQRLVVVDDCRFLNEYEVVKARPSGKVWRITRPDAAVTAAHASEGQLDAVAVDAEIANDGTIAELHAKIDFILQS